MSMSDVDEVPHCEEATWFCGLARVSLESLVFDRTLSDGHRDISPRNVARLVDVFRTEGCKRLEAENFIKATVKRHELDATLTSQRGSLIQCPPEDWYRVPILQIQSVNCINGLHRVTAAREYLDENDRWWIVRLYSDDIPSQWSNQNAERHGNEQSHTDGEIFRKIRYYNLSENINAERRWWARLSKSKKSDLKQLLKIKSITKAFDTMIPWPGLWAAIDIGAFRRITRMKCYEEVVNYLQHIIYTWSFILDGTSDAFPGATIDSATVRCLESLAPKMSVTDAGLVTSLMEEDKIFTSVQDESDRAIIHSNLMECFMIPSLHTFIENMKYLEPCVQVLRRLLPSIPRRSIYREFSAVYVQPSEPVVEYGAYDSRLHPRTLFVQDRNIAYQQLWLFALRHFPCLTGTAPRKDSKDVSQRCGENPVVAQMLGILSVSLGFATENARSLAAQDGTAELVAQLLDRRGITGEAAHETKRSIIQDLRSGQQKSCEKSSPNMHDHDHDCPNLFLPVMYSMSHIPGEHISTLYCKWEMFRAFFGTHNMPQTSFDAAAATSETQNVNFTQSQADPFSAAGDLETMETLRQKAVTQKIAIDRLKADCDNYINLATKATERESNMSRNVQSLQAEADRLRSQAEASRSSAKALEEARIELSRLDSESSQKSEEIKRLRATLASGSQAGQHELQQAKLELSETSRRANDLAIQLASAQVDKQNIESERDKFDAELSDLRKQLFNAAAKAEVDGDERGRLYKQLEANANEVQTAKEELEKTTRDTEALERQLRTLRACLDNQSAAMPSTVPGLSSNVTQIAGESQAALSLEMAASERRRLQHFSFLVDVLEETSIQEEESRVITQAKNDTANDLELRLVALAGTEPRASIAWLSPKDAASCLKTWSLSIHGLAYLVGSQAPKTISHVNSSFITAAWSQQGVLWVMRQTEVAQLLRLWTSYGVWHRNLCQFSDATRARKPKRKAPIEEQATEEAKKVQVQDVRICTVQTSEQFSTSEAGFPNVDGSPEGAQTVPSDLDFITDLSDTPPSNCDNGQSEEAQSN